MDMNGQKEIKPLSGLRFKEIREKLNLSQGDCAKAMKFKRQTISGWERDLAEVDEFRLPVLFEKYPEFEKYKDYILFDEPIKKDVAPPRPPEGVGDSLNSVGILPKTPLKKLRESLRWHQVKMGKLLQMKQGSYSDLELGKSALTEKHIEKLDRAFRGNPLFIRSDFEAWLVEQAPTKGVLRNEKETLPSSSIKPKIPFFDRYVPESNKDVSTIIQDMDQNATEHLDIFFWNGYATYSGTIYDEAMEDPFSYGCKVVAVVEDNQENYEDNLGDVHVIFYHGKQYVRRVFPGKDDEHLILRSADKKKDDYPDIKVKKNDITLFGLAVGGIKVKQIRMLAA